MTDPAAAIPTSGTLKGNTHYLPIRVYYEDTDSLGMVYHGTYLKYMERGRTEFLRCLGILNPELAEREDGMLWAVHSANIRFIKIAKPDDALVVVSKASHLGAASATIEQKIMRGSELIFEGTIKVASIDHNGRPKRMPKDILEKFQKLEKQLKSSS